MDIIKDINFLNLVKGSQENEKKAIDIIKNLFGLESEKY